MLFKLRQAVKQKRLNQSDSLTVAVKPERCSASLNNRPDFPQIVSISTTWSVIF
jgi:hypothetical protein